MLSNPNVNINLPTKVCESSGVCMLTSVKQNKWTPLHAACNGGYTECVKVLLSHPRVDVNLPAKVCTASTVIIVDDVIIIVVSLVVIVVDVIVIVVSLVVVVVVVFIALLFTHQKLQTITH